MLTVAICFALALVMLAIAGVAKAAVDELTHQEDNNVFIKRGAWYDARTSWKLKYKDYDAGDLRPRFFKSTTWFVLFTDFWHAADAVYLTSYMLGSMSLALGLAAWLGLPASLPWQLAALALGRIYVSLWFEPFYTKHFRIKPAA
jgi:hypothetical protein